MLIRRRRSRQDPPSDDLYLYFRLLLSIKDGHYAEWGSLSSFDSAPQDTRPREETTSILIVSSGYRSIGMSLYLPENVTYRFDVDDVNWVAEPATTGVELSIIEYSTLPSRIITVNSVWPEHLQAPGERMVLVSVMEFESAEREPTMDVFRYTGCGPSQLYRSPLCEPIPLEHQHVSLCGGKPCRQRVSL